jgi:hypothetical protein
VAAGWFTGDAGTMPGVMHPYHKSFPENESEGA